MASEDALLLRSMRGFSREKGNPLEEPALRSQAASEIEQVEGGESLDELRSRYDKLRSDELRPEYRGFKVPAGMDEGQSEDWFASIDAREDERERKEAEPFLTRTPEPWEGQFLEQMKGLNIEASKEEQRFLRDPAGRAEVYKEFAGDVYEDVMAGDAETIRNVADVTSLTDPTGVSDVVSATQSGRLAISDPERRMSHLADTAISGTAGGIQVLAAGFGAAPLVGSLLSGARLKAAMRGADVADDVSDAARASRVSGAGVRRLFHASPADIDEFRPSLTGRYGSGVYMSASPDEGFARAAKGVFDEAPDSGNVLTLDVDLRNPLAYDDKIADISADQRQALIDSINKNGGEGESFLGQFGPDASLGDFYNRMLGTAGNPGARPGRGQSRSAQQVVKDAGYDGIIAPGGEEFIAFDPSAIKIVSKDRVGDAAKAVPDAPAPVFESVLERVVLEKAPNKIGVDDVEKFLAGKGAKKSEIAETKIPDLIDGAKAAGKKSISKDELIKHLDDNKVQIEEVRLGGDPTSLKPLRKAVEKAYFPARKATQAFRKRLSGDGIKTSPDLLHRLEDNIDVVNEPFQLEIVNLAQEVRSADDRASQRIFSLNRSRVDNIPVRLTDEAEEVADFFRNRVLDGLGEGLSPEFKALPIEDQMQEIEEAFSKVNDLYTVKRTSLPRRSGGGDRDFIFTIANPKRQAQKALNSARNALKSTQELKNSDEFKKYESARRDFDLERAKLPKNVASYKKYTLPGGDNYQEILLTVPNKNQKILDDPDVQELKSIYEMMRVTNTAELKPETAEFLKIDKYNALSDKVYAKYGVSDDVEVSDWLQSLRTEPFTGSHHSNIPNVMAHIRTKDRVDSKGRKILFVEEIQSDWHQKGREFGYRGGKVRLESYVESAILEMESAQKALLDWHKKNPEPPNRDRATFLAMERPMTDLVAEITASRRGEEFVSPWKKSLPKEDQDILDASQAYISKLDELSDLEKEAHAAAKRLSNEISSSSSTFMIYRHTLDEFGNVRFSTNVDGTVSSNDFRGSLTRYRDKELQSGKVPDAPLKDTKEWTALAIKRIFREAADGDYDGVAFTRGQDIAGVVGGVEKGQNYFYDKLIPSIAKKESKAKQETTFIDVGDESLGVPFFELTDKVKDRVIKPQKLYSVALPGIAIGAAAAEEEELSAAAALGAIGLGGMALYKGMKGARAAASIEPHLITKADWKKSINQERIGPKVANTRRYTAAIADELDDLPSAMKMYGRDFAYEQPELVRKMTGIKPDDKVKIYRAISADDPADGILPGDWVALDRSYADMHGSSGYGDVGSKIVELEVPAKEIVWAGTSADEWHYAPLSARDNTVKSGHEAFVKDAIREGKEVPEEVLKDYPDLRAAADVAKPPAATAGVSKSEVASAEKLAKKKTLACGDCFRYASKNAKEGDKVIHANVEGLEGPHAWIEREGRVFDWQGKQGVWYFQEGLGKEEYMQTGWPIDEFYKTFKPKDMVVYTEEEALINGVRAQNWGPWFPEERFAFGKATPHKPPAPAAAVRSQRDPEEGNPEEELPPMTLSSREYVPMDTVMIYDDTVEETKAELDRRSKIKQEQDGLVYKMMMLEADYFELDDDDPRKDQINSQYELVVDKFKEVHSDLGTDEFSRFLKGVDYFYETQPGGLLDYDVDRAFEVMSFNGVDMLTDINLRKTQESMQQKRFERMTERGGTLVNLSGQNMSINKLLFKKANTFNHPVQSVQVTESDKMILQRDLNNLEDLKEDGLISYLLYRELKGDVMLF
jgi:hypothetical protein